MGRGDTPGALEQMVLLALAGRAGEAAGREVYEALIAATGHEVSVAAIHITLSRLEEKGWALSRTEAPEPGRGGKPRRWYRLSEEGGRVLADLRARMARLWEGASGHPHLRGDG